MSTLASTSQEASTRRRVEIDFLFCDLTTCSRCLGTEENLESALEAVEKALTSTGVEVAVRKTLVESEDQARELRFVSSPTIRINGRDIASELRESRCPACGDVCAEEVDCRVWIYQGREYTEAPVGMIVEAILREVYGVNQRLEPKPAPYEKVPENLKRFFSGKAKQEATEDGAAAQRPPREESRSGKGLPPGTPRDLGGLPVSGKRCTQTLGFGPGEAEQLASPGRSR